VKPEALAPGAWFQMATKTFTIKQKYLDTEEK
jgi:hypothetical protein